MTGNETQTSPDDGGDVGKEDVDWKAEAKKFQSLYDKSQAEAQQRFEDLESKLSNLEPLVKLAERVDQAPESVTQHVDLNSGHEDDEFDVFEINNPETSSGRKFRDMIKQQVQSGLEGYMSKVQQELALNNVRNQLATKYGMDAEQVENFIEFATTPKGNMPLDDLVRIYSLYTNPQDANLKAVDQTQQEPPSAGALESSEPPPPDETDEVWKGILQAGGAENAF